MLMFPNSPNNEPRIDLSNNKTQNQSLPSQFIEQQQQRQQSNKLDAKHMERKHQSDFRL